MPGHAMPFGAALTDAGVRFRLWAPAAGQVELVLRIDGERRSIPMAAVGGGWFERTTPQARAGSRYGYRIDGAAEVPDPASRFQPDDVHGPSAVVDPHAFLWRAADWRGRPWHEAVLYELHVGTFSPAGSFNGVRERLDHLAALGVTAIELMPVADFAGRRNWGYDGVLPYAPDSTYGTPDDLKRLVDDAHARGLMMMLDVVYNHFGPDGNFLHLYAPEFFTQRFSTPWGAAIDFARREVREFVIHNALYWLEEYRFDGLRLDAVHAIFDESAPDILEELAVRVQRRLGDARHVHLVLENGNNAARYLERESDGRPRFYTAQWNDDLHHAFHVLATGEHAGYYADYADRPLDHLARCLGEGFAYQGEPSRHLGEPRGSPSAHLPPAAFVSFLQNHDQIGNRAFGERITALAEPYIVKTLTAIMLLAPSPPLLFMGEEWGAPQPFLFFCDFRDALAESVRDGRRREFARFPEFADEASRQAIPDPNSAATFERSRLDWSRFGDAPHAEWLELHRTLLRLRAQEIAPRLAGMQGGGRVRRFGAGGLSVTWRLGDGTALGLLANLAPAPCSEALLPPAGQVLYATSDELIDTLGRGRMPAWSAAWFLG
jgi:malto-oligosyltrehalose trehalohydrolase